MIKPQWLPKVPNIFNSIKWCILCMVNIFIPHKLLKYREEPIMDIICLYKLAHIWPCNAGVFSLKLFIIQVLVILKIWRSLERKINDSILDASITRSWVSIINWGLIFLDQVSDGSMEVYRILMNLHRVQEAFLPIWIVLLFLPLVYTPIIGMFNIHMFLHSEINCRLMDILIVGELDVCKALFAITMVIDTES